MNRTMFRAAALTPLAGCLIAAMALLLPSSPPPTARPTSNTQTPRPSWTMPSTSAAPTPSPTDPSHSRTDISASPTTTTQPAIAPGVPTRPRTRTPEPSRTRPRETDTVPMPGTQTRTRPPVTVEPTTPAPTTAAPEPTTAAPTTSGPAPSTVEPTTAPLDTISARYTGYGFADNDCGGPGDCTAYGDGHAGGTGTWDDPVSVAVGADQLGQWPAGTVLYLVDLHRYGIVEDRCGACTGAWVDVWVDGRGSADAGVACMRSFTGDGEVVLNPPSDLPVTPGVISTSEGCAR